MPEHTLSKGRLSRSEDFNRAFPTFLPLQPPLDKGETSVKITAKSKAHRSLRLSHKIVCLPSLTPYHTPIGSSVRVGKQLKDLQDADSLSQERSSESMGETKMLEDFEAPTTTTSIKYSLASSQIKASHIGLLT